ncbi:MAG: TrkH family potassium uptake protein [Desulfobulbaceae bacterium]|uniref:TrkH family potassium uptake protein n=1 Tax=Candidatus Desulfatifera sulfidica TaxID=2841691 RepID=A0A8J6N916_9BACT|nr:TrkH family potassium uptake protein [Candidatus Desulfatifera sulfidica]
MRTGGVLNFLGRLLLVLSLLLLTPIPFSLYYHDGMVGAFILSALMGAIAGGLLVALFRPEKELGYRDGFAIVVLSWVMLAFLGALPYYFSGQMVSFIDCYFESMSGFTTTGSTILVEVEILSRSLLFWRALTHWLGGMGIIVLTLAVLPLLGVGGMQLFQAEMPGPTKDRLAPRIQSTARILWSVYVLFTLFEVVLLMLGGVDFFNALCHSFATLATGGFSTHTTSIAFYDSIYVELVVILFMFLAGINFALHFQMLTGRSLVFWRNEELRLYVALIVTAIVLIMTANYVYGTISTFGDDLRQVVFQVVSVVTTTGFGTADFDQWPSMCKVLLVSLMFVGGCAGSTAGGIKVVRILLFFKYARLQLQRLVHPHQVGGISYGGSRVSQEILIAILGFFALYLVFFLAASLMVTAMGVDIVTGITAVIATLNNIGPGLNLVGPSQDFGHLPDTVKVVLTFCMLAGRLELYTLAVLLTPGFWKMARRPLLRSWASFGGQVSHPKP